MDEPTPRRFAFYERLSAKQQRIYRKSDAITQVPLDGAAAIRPRVTALREALDGGERQAVQRAAERVCGAILRDLGVGPVDLEVLESRPRGGYGELYGLYTWDDGARPRIQVWMRTAARGKVVAFKTFLRTLLHEIGHHLDLQMLGLEETFHTRGFYARENSLFGQIAGELAEQAPQRPKVRASPSPPPETRPVVPSSPEPRPQTPARRGGRQLTLPGID